jgi:hypothetical protein
MREQPRFSRNSFACVAVISLSARAILMREFIASSIQGDVIEMR